MAKSKPVRVAVVGDSSDLKKALAQAEDAMEDMERTARTTSDKVDAAFSSTAEAADQTASGAAQLAGGIGDLTGALEANGLISESTVAKMETLEKTIMGVTGAGDLLNFATEKLPGLQKLATVTTNGLAVAKRALGVAIRFAMGPVGLIIGAITLLTAGVVLLWKRNEKFREIVTAVWEGAKTAVSAAADWIGEKVGALIGFFTRLPGRMKTAVTGLWDGLKDSFRAAVNWIIDGWNNFGLKAKIPDWVPGVGGNEIGISTPDIPRLAAGGIVTRPTLAWVGEQGPEAVVPLNGRYNAGATISIHVDAGPVADPVAVGRQLMGILDAYLIAGGRSRAGGMYA